MNEFSSGRASSVLGHDFTPQVLWPPAPSSAQGPAGQGPGQRAWRKQAEPAFLLSALHPALWSPFGSPFTAWGGGRGVL